MSQFNDIDIFAGPERDMMGVPITGSSRDRQLDALEGMARQRYVDPAENSAKNMFKMQVAEALSSVPGIKGEAISSIIALADSQNPDDKLMFNQIVSRLDLPVDVRRMGDDYAVSKRFEDVLGDNSSVGVSAYLPDEGDDEYSLSAEKRFPNFLGGEARVGGNISTGGDPEIRASFMRRFANGGDVDLYDADIFESPLDRLAQPVRGDLGPMQQIVAEEEGLRGKAKRLLAGAMGDDRQAYRRAGKLLGAADLTPVLGDVAAVADVSDAYRAGDPFGLGLAALGFIPGIGGTLSKAGKGLRGAPSISSEGIPQPPKISKKEAVPLLKQQFIEEQPPIGSFDEATGKPVTEKLNRDRANAYERSIVKGPPAVFRRELFRLGSKVERQPLAERKIINPEVLKDYVGVPVVGDMSARIKNPTSQPYPEDAGILSVRGVPLSRRVIPEGGFQFTADSEGAEKGWSSMEGIATKKQGNIILAAEKTGKDPIGIFSAMGAESMDFTSPTLEMMIAQIPAIRIPKADLAAFDKVIREGTKTVKPRPQWVGLDSPDVFNQILGEGGFDRGGAGALRIDLLAEMKKDRWKKLGFPIYDDAYQTMKAQEFDEAVKNSTGLSMYRADPNRGVFDEPYHKSYNKAFPAMKDQEYLGGLVQGVPPEIMFPDTFKDLSQQITNPKGGGKPRPFKYSEKTGSLVMNPKLYEEYDDEKIQGIIDYLNEYAGTDYAEGGAVNVDDIDIFGER